jgi:hypothetical protein
MLLITVLVVGLLLGIPLWGSRKGLVHVLTVGLCLVLAEIAVVLLVPLLSHALPIGSARGPAAVAGWWHFILWSIFTIAAFPIGAYLTRFTSWNLEPFDNLLGLLSGVVLGFVVSRILLSSLVQMYTGDPFYEVMQQHALVRQIVFLDSWHAFTGWLDATSQAPDTAIE